MLEDIHRQAVLSFDELSDDDEEEDESSDSESDSSQSK